MLTVPLFENGGNSNLFPYGIQQWRLFKPLPIFENGGY